MRKQFVVFTSCLVPSWDFAMWREPNSVLENFFNFFLGAFWLKSWKFFSISKWIDVVLISIQLPCHAGLWLDFTFVFACFGWPSPIKTMKRPDSNQIYSGCKWYLLWVTILFNGNHQLWRCRHPAFRSCSSTFPARYISCDRGRRKVEFLLLKG